MSLGSYFLQFLKFSKKWKICVKILIPLLQHNSAQKNSQSMRPAPKIFHYVSWHGPTKQNRCDHKIFQFFFKKLCVIFLFFEIPKLVLITVRVPSEVAILNNNSTKGQYVQKNTPRKQRNGLQKWGNKYTSHCVRMVLQPTSYELVCGLSHLHFRSFKL